MRMHLSPNDSSVFLCACRCGRLVVLIAAVFLLLFLPDFAVAEDDWLTIRDTDLRIVPGSALDFSGFFAQDLNNSPIGVNKNGQLAEAGGAGKRVRFLCAVLLYTTPHGKFPDHATADALAVQLRMAGYNLARLHFVETTLTEGAKHDFDFDPVQVDRLHYLLAALKKQGIRWMIDAATSWNGAYADVGNNRFAKVHDLQVSVHYDPEAQAHWKLLVQRILNVKNRYTGTVILRDSALLAVTLFNESGLGFGTRKSVPPELFVRFRQWSAGKLASGNRKDSVSSRRKSNEAVTLQHFFTEMEIGTLEWMTTYLRSLGYSGLVTNYNNGKSLQAAASRAATELVAVHAYYDHPTDFIRGGSRQKGASSLGESLPYVQYFGGSRYLGKPFIVDEYDHPYWSPWRREAGIAVPAYAALQDWDAIARFANPVHLEYRSDDAAPRNRAIHPFAIGMDPIARAGETLAALLFRRGDVSQSTNTVATLVSSSVAHSSFVGKDGMPKDVGRQVFVSRTGAIWEGQLVEEKIVLSTQPDVGGGDNINARLNSLIDTVGSRWQEKVERLRRVGVLKPANQTNPSGTIYQSDTGEVVLDVAHKSMYVVTRQTEATAFEKLSAPFTLGQMTIVAADGPALVAISSLDNKGLAASKRMLLIVATDCINNNSLFSTDRSMLEKLGSLPVLIRGARISIRLKREEGANMALYSLALNGRRKERISLPSSGSDLLIPLDTKKLEEGPTTYFELVMESPEQK